MSKWPSRMDILTLMESGWSLGISRSLSGGRMGGAWMQEGKLGYGGQSIDVHRGTFTSLLRRGFIKSKSGYHFPTEEFVLTDADIAADKLEEVLR